MGFIPSLLGLVKNKGADFQAQGADLQMPIDMRQAQVANQNVLGGIDQQQQFLQALQGQNGIGNQQDVFQQQQQLAQQLQAGANGQGPNPALQQLQNATGQNVAQQAALMGGQRGASSNVGMMARQIGQQGAGIQQQAAGQGALMQAQQQMAFQQALQQQQAQMAALSSQQVGQQGGAITGLNSMLSGNQNSLFNQINAQNQAQVGMQSNVNNANASIQQQVAKSQGDILKSVGDSMMNVSKGAGGGGASSMAMMSKGGEVGPKSNVGKHLCMGGSYKGGGKVRGKAKVDGDSPKNDTVPAMLSPGEIVVPRSHAKDPEKAAAFARAVAMKYSKR